MKAPLARAIPMEKQKATNSQDNVTRPRGPVHLFISELKPGDKLSQFFQIQSVELRKTRTGSDFLDMVVRDSTASISARLWSETIKRCGANFSSGDVVKIDGHVDTYRDHNQIIVDNIRKAGSDELDNVAVFHQRSQEKAELFFEELMAFAKELRPQSLCDLVVTLIHENEIALKTCPAAKMVHHAYQGGLIEHLVGVTRRVASLVAQDAKMNKDLAIAGAIVHDIGKTLELKPLGQTRTTEGRLIGHVILGFEMINRLGYEKQCSHEPWFLELQHIILSHHGHTEFGAPVRPATREALLIHYIDMLDSRLKILDEALESQDSDGFTAYIKWLDGRGYAGRAPSVKEERND